MSGIHFYCQTFGFLQMTPEILKDKITGPNMFVIHACMFNFISVYLKFLKPNLSDPKGWVNFNYQSDSEYMKLPKYHQIKIRNSKIQKSNPQHTPDKLGNYTTMTCLSMTNYINLGWLLRFVGVLYGLINTSSHGYRLAHVPKTTTSSIFLLPQRFNT
jgi:hypothetical protein